MIIAKLYGGLGNQMFQYAFARRIAYKHNVPLKLDLGAMETALDPEKYTARDFQLNVFNIDAEIADKKDVFPYQYKGKFAKMLDLLALYIPYKKVIFLREPKFEFFAPALKAPANAYTDGYWQSEKYFSDIRDVILKEFAPITVSDKTIELAQEIKNCNSCGVHVRRGDYISIAHNQTIYETCSVDYYKKAIDRIAKEKGDPVLFVFSDDPEWFEVNVQTPYRTVFIKHNTGNNSYEDIYLMSLCMHNIIANSSFSWWGAWLNQNSGKMVVAPERWFRDGKSTKDLICSSWIQL